MRIGLVYQLSKKYVFMSRFWPKSHPAMLTPAHNTIVADGTLALETIDVVIGFNDVTGGGAAGDDDGFSAVDDGGLPPDPLVVVWVD